MNFEQHKYMNITALERELNKIKNSDDFETIYKRLDIIETACKSSKRLIENDYKKMS